MHRHRMILSISFFFASLFLIPSRALTQQCGEYDRAIAELTEDQKQLLTRYKVLWNQGPLLISRELIPDCNLSDFISRFIATSLHGSLSEAGRRFAQTHQLPVNRAVLHIWPLIANSPAIPNDGALADEKWSILAEPALYDSTIARLISGNIRRFGLRGSAANILMRRAIPSFSPQIYSVLTKSTSHNVEKLYAIAILSKLPIHGEKNISLLTRTIHGLQLTDAEQKAASNLKHRFESNHPAEWKDIDMLVQEEL